MGDPMTRVYRKGVLEAEGFPVADVSEYLEEPDTVVWVDFCGPSKEQLHELAAELGLHELAVEDALGPHQRPKLDRYATHLFLSCHAVRVDVEGGALDETEIDAFINERWLITVRKNDGFSIDPVLRALGPLARPRGPRGQLPALRPARRHRRQLLRCGPVLRRVLRGGQRRDLRGPSSRSRPAAALVRHAPRHGPVPSPGRPDARGDQQPHAARALRRRRSSCIPTSRTSTTTSCASASPPTRSATSSAPSSRRTSACATTARTRS